MCGRYAVTASADEIAEELDVDADETGGPVPPRFNLAPTDLAPVVVQRHPRGQAGVAASGEGEAARRPPRTLRLLKWGLVPAWAKDASVGNRMINARADTLLDSRAYGRAARVRRALIPAAGWYEWQRSPVATDAKGRPRRQPFFVRLSDGGPLAFAGVYEFWRDRAVPDGDPAGWLVTFAVVTTDAEPGLDLIHERMPVVLPRERWEGWLDPDLDDPRQVASMLEPVAPGRFVAYPVSSRVGNVGNDDPSLLDPAPADELDGVLDPATGELWGS
jgi:putative SOS response-associated peptidase YedK